MKQEVCAIDYLKSIGGHIAIARDHHAAVSVINAVAYGRVNGRVLSGVGSDLEVAILQNFSCRDDLGVQYAEFRSEKCLAVMSDTVEAVHPISLIHRFDNILYALGPIHGEWSKAGIDP